MHATGPRLDVTYILPIKSTHDCATGELDAYIRWLAPMVELLIVDGSDSTAYDAHATAWRDVATHVPPHQALVTPMGKVGGVLTGVALASHERLIIADDDVRYDAMALSRVARALDDADVVRPQNYFRPLPWHARWDSARSLLNRISGGDWPGTLGVRRSMLRRTNGYDGSAMFENLELVRTVMAAGGREQLLLDVLILRRPSSTSHFWSQRIRQAYDEFARPRRLATQLAILPLTLLCAFALGWRAVLVGLVLLMALAEIGRRRSGGARVFPASTPLFAPAWVAERAICSWLAVASHLILGGVSYRGRVLPHAATPLRELRERFAQLRIPTGDPDSTPPHRSA